MADPIVTKFTIVPSTSRKEGYSIKVPPWITWAQNPGNTFGWYKRKVDAQKRADELNMRYEGR